MPETQRRFPEWRVRLGAVWVLAALPLSVSMDAGAIISRDDVPDADYVVQDADYPEVVDLFEPGDCTGTLIHQSFLLTVAHCAEDLDAGAVLVVDGIDHEVAEVTLHPQWDGWLYDIALIRFDVPVRGLTPVPLYRGGDEVGQMLTLVGRGVHATGLEGERGGTIDGQLRRATNVVSAVCGQWLEVFFEPPNDPNATDLEGVGAEGDSGGPAFIENEDGRFLAGLNSWGDADRGSDIGKYGSWDNSTRVSVFARWIDGELGTVPPERDDDTPAPPSPNADSECSGGGGCQITPGVGAPIGWIGGVFFVLGLWSRLRARRP